MGASEGIPTYIRGLSIDMIPNTMNAAPILPSTANEWRTWGPGPFRYLVEWWKGMNQIGRKGEDPGFLGGNPHSRLTGAQRAS